MQEDLFDALSAFDEAEGADGAQRTFLPRREVSAVLQEARVSQPWKSDEDKGRESKPNDLEGAAAGAKSYNAQSGQIFGILEQMLTDFKQDLKEAKKAESDAIAAFQRLSSAKQGEVASSTKIKTESEQKLSVTLADTAEAKKELDALSESLEADQTMLIELKKGCKKSEQEYEVRVKTRNEELKAIQETIKILSEDDARDLFSKTVGFLQLGSHRLLRASDAAGDGTGSSRGAREEGLGSNVVGGPYQARCL